jgi:hypothetical protein
MQKSLTIIIIKKFIMNFWNFLPFHNMLWLVYGHKKSSSHPPPPPPQQELQMCYVSGKAAKGGSKIAPYSENALLWGLFSSVKAQLLNIPTSVKVLWVGGHSPKEGAVLAILGNCPPPLVWPLPTKSPQP